MKLTESTETERPQLCDVRSECRRESDKAYAASLFERPWDEFVVRREKDGKYRSYTQCCGYLTRA